MAGRGGAEKHRQPALDPTKLDERPPRPDDPDRLHHCLPALRAPHPCRLACGPLRPPVPASDSMANSTDRVLVVQVDPTVPTPTDRHEGPDGDDPGRDP